MTAPDLARITLWENGIVAPWYLRGSQLDLYEVLLAHNQPFLECARRFGKTTTVLCYVVEKLLQNANWVCMWCEPDKNQAREILMPEIDKLFASSPKWLRPKYVTTDSYYLFRNGSKLKLRGVNHDRGDSARGSYAHIIVNDEFGFWRDPDYIVQSALAPQLQTTRGQMIFASTPAEDLAHAYYEHKERAIHEGRFIRKTIFENESLHPADIEEEARKVGGKDSPAWKREYLCQEVSDPDRLVVPEYREVLHDLDDAHPRPDFFDAYVGVDLGFNDCTAILFGYWDFLNATLVIEDELVVSGKNSKEIAEAARQKEIALWGAEPPYMRIGDNDRQQLYDLQTLCNYTVLATRKDDKLAAINALRLRFTASKIKIKQRCKSLRYQLKVGLWNERKTDFQRGEKTSHLDAIDALIYLHRNLHEHHNPWPQHLGKSEMTHWMHNLPSPNDKDTEALEKALGVAVEETEFFSGEGDSFGF